MSSKNYKIFLLKFVFKKLICPPFKSDFNFKKYILKILIIIKQLKVINFLFSYMNKWNLWITHSSQNVLKEHQMRFLSFVIRCFLLKKSETLEYLSMSGWLKDKALAKMVCSNTAISQSSALGYWEMWWKQGRKWTDTF